MVPEIGDLIHILKDTHGYPINWIPGMNTVIRFHNGSIGILVEISAPDSRGDEPRTFYTIATPQGLVSIFSGYTRIIK